MDGHPQGLIPWGGKSREIVEGDVDVEADVYIVSSSVLRVLAVVNPVSPQNPAKLTKLVPPFP